MSHKTMIDGVAYEISGGKTLVDGTAYSIKNGKTLIGGTAYEVGFVEPVPVITVVSGEVSGSGMLLGFRASLQGMPIDGMVYAGSTNLPASVEVPAGTTITCTISAGSGTPGGNIKLNGTIVANFASGKKEYSYVVTTNATITLYVSDGDGYIEIVET